MAVEVEYDGSVQGYDWEKWVARSDDVVFYRPRPTESEILAHEMKRPPLE
jgi:hypothetical protein